ncbi:MAG: lipo-like protein [Burkholderiales bacterium]|nr:lipo-like protein [Burkholderiales bacterium]
MSGILDRIAAWTGERLGRYLSQPRHTHGTAAPTDPRRLMACLRPGDVVLVEGQTRISVAIQYLTQSTWSHAALYIGDAAGQIDAEGRPRCFLEADIRDGVRVVSVAEFAGLHCRVCRPVGLGAAETDAVTRFALARLGHRYDLKNVVDLARYLLPTPPVPQRWRRRMLSLGSGDPTRAICSTLIAQAFQSVRYPILPIVENVPSADPMCPGCVAEILRVRHHSLFVPRDFDVSPYFDVVKPTLAVGFDHRVLAWHDDARAVAA